MTWAGVELSVLFARTSNFELKTGFFSDSVTPANVRRFLTDDTGVVGTWVREAGRAPLRAEPLAVVLVVEPILALAGNLSSNAFSGLPVEFFQKVNKIPNRGMKIL